MDKMSKITTNIVVVVGIAVLGVLATNSICSNCLSNTLANFVGNDQADDNKLIINLNTNNFDTTVAKGAVLVDFWARWCQPCSMQASVLEKVAEKTAGKAIIGKVNVEHSSFLANRFEIQSIPTLILFINGIEVQRFVGVHSERFLIEIINNANNAN